MCVPFHTRMNVHVRKIHNIAVYQELCTLKTRATLVIHMKY